MKKLAAALAVILFATLMSGVAGAQNQYAPEPPPVHQNVAADGTLTLDFSGTEFAPGSTVAVLNSAGEQVATGTIGANGFLTLANAASLANQPLTFRGTRNDGGIAQSAVKTIGSAPAPTAIPQVVVAAPAPVQAVVTGNAGQFTPKAQVSPRVITQQAQSPAVPLAVTGSDVNVPVMVGTSLILVGAAAIVAGRRRAEAI